MKSRARRRRLLKHLHPEHGMSSREMMDAYIKVGIAEGKYQSELARLRRANDVLAPINRQINGVLHKMVKTNSFELQTELGKLEAESEKARSETRGASEALWQARLENSVANANLIRMRWWQHVKAKVQL